MEVRNFKDKQFLKKAITGLKYSDSELESNSLSIWHRQNDSTQQTARKSVDILRGLYDDGTTNKTNC